MQIQTSKNSGYRTFLDARGRVWEVWMVHPSSIERRKMERRSPIENAVFLIEQRVLGDRRTQLGTRGNVASEYSNGWLCFASNGEKRRLAPPLARLYNQPLKVQTPAVIKILRETQEGCTS